MPDPIIINGKKFITSKQGAALTGYARDYIGQLVRMGKVKGQVVDKTLFVSEDSLLAHKAQKNANSKILENHYKTAIAKKVEVRSENSEIAEASPEAFIAFPKLSKIKAKNITGKKLVSRLKNYNPLLGTFAKISPYADSIGRISLYILKHAIGTVAVLTIFAISYAEIKNPENFAKNISKSFSSVKNISLAEEPRGDNITAGVFDGFNSLAQKLNQNINTFIGIGKQDVKNENTTVVLLPSKVQIATTTVIREITTTPIIKYLSSNTSLGNSNNQVTLLAQDFENYKATQLKQLDYVFSRMGKTSGGTTVTNNSIFTGTTTLKNLTIENTSTTTIPNLESSTFTLNGKSITDLVGAGLELSNGVLNATAGSGFSTTSTDYWESIKTRWATTSDSFAFDTRLAATTTLNNLTTLRGLTDLVTTNATATSLSINGDYITDLTGSGLSVVNGALTSLGDGTFSTTSANYWETIQTRWATTSSAYFLSTKSTSNLTEGSNLYFTNSRADDRVISILSATTSLPNLGSVSALAITSLNCTVLSNGGKVTTDASGNLVCANDQVGSGGGGGTDVNWTYFNSSGISVSTTTNQVVIGASATSSLQKLEVIGGAYISGNLGIGTTSPYAKLSVNGESVATKFTASSLTGTSTFPNISINSILLNSDYITDLTGSGLSVVNGALTLDSSTLWSTTSASYAFDTRLAATTTLNNITTLGSLSLPVTQTTGTLSVARGGTGQTSFGQGWLASDGSTLTASTSPTVNYITATSTTATSTFPLLSSSAFALNGDYITDLTGSGLSLVNGALTVQAASTFSTTSTDYWLTTKSTTGLTEGSNLYYTDARVASVLTATTSLPNLVINVANQASGVLSISHGGTGVSTLPSGGFLIGNGTGAITSTTSPTVGYITGTSTATSSFAGSIDVTGTGCLAVNGACIGGSNLTGAGSADKVAYWNGASGLTYASSFVWDSANSKLQIPTLNLTSTSSLLQISGTTLLRADTTTNNFFAGQDSGNTTVSGSFNTSVGQISLKFLTTGSGNAALGRGALNGVTSGSYNIGIGFNALSAVDTSSNNIGIGASSLNSLTSGSGNVALGSSAGASISSGSNNTFIGNGTDILTDGISNATAIGYNAKVGASNSLVLGNGVNVGIGTTSPYAMLSVAGQTVAQYFTATSTTATSTFPLLSSSAFALNGQYVTSLWSTTSASYAFDTRLAATTTLNNITTLGSLSLPVTQTTGTLSVARGGTGQTSFGQGWLASDGSTLTASTSPTVNYITATSTTATSTFPNLFATNFNLGNSYYTSLVGYGLTNSNNLLTVATTAVRTFFSSSATGLTYTSSTGDFALTSGYSIPLTASTTEWNSFYTTPSTRITAGTGLSWSSNTLSTVQDITTSGKPSFASTTLSNFTLGSIPFFATGGAMGQDNANFFWDSANARLGIGSTTPWAQLSVNPNGIAGPEFAIGSSTATHFLVTTQGRVGVGSTTPWGLVGIQTPSTLTSPAFSIGSSTATAFVVTGGGKVGVGNSAPTFPLQVSTSDTNGIALQIDSSSATSASFNVKSTATGGLSWGIRSTANSSSAGGGRFAIRDESNGIWRVALDGANGNFGIGTTSPYATLSVVGQAVAQYFTATSTTATSTIKGFLDVLGTGTNSTSTISSNLWVKGSLRANLSYVGDLIFSNNFRFVEAASTSTTQYLYLKTNHGTDAITFDENGNVAIGSNTNPLYKLQVNGDVAATSFVNISTAEAKRDISYLGDGEKMSVLSKINSIRIAHYRYKTEDSSNPLRLGLIAEESPSEILSVGGKGVDIYKLATFTLAGVQAQQKQIDAINIRLSDIEAKIATGLASSTPSLASFISSITGLNLEKLTIGSAEKPNGITLYDEVTHAPYCLSIANGNMKSVPGDCGSIIQNPTPVTPTNTPVIVDTATTTPPVASTTPEIITNVSTTTTTIAPPVIVPDPTPVIPVVEPVVVPVPTPDPVVTQP